MENTISKFEGKYRFLSNFYECLVKFFRVIYPTAEHVYQAMKSEDPDIRQKIKECKTPGQAKRLGNKIALRSNWNDIKYNIMLSIIICKFTQHPDLKEKLLATEDFKLIEGNTWDDTYWGVCKGVGENKLGEILMLVRDSLKNCVGCSLTD